MISSRCSIDLSKRADLLSSIKINEDAAGYPAALLFTINLSLTVLFAMTQKIRILPENLCNKIAAGEVVERPSSVVKELLENSIDAGSTEISVEIEKGGKKLIRISDNGEGMGRDDAFLCLERHATSKIRTDDDLFHVNTLGFRGEALPSIASVSRFLLTTCAKSAMEGWELYAEGGTVLRSGPAGLAEGTVIDVRDLFFNTPARRKFLRRDETEISHITDVVTKIAMAHPDVRFCLFHNGRSLLEVNAHASLEERVGKLLGRSLLPDLLPVTEEGPTGIALHGLLSQPSLNRSTTSNIYTFINGRFVRDRVVQHAIMEAYRSLLERGRYPVVVLFIDIDPELVDVNVHPTKQEVRFRDQKGVHDFISMTLRNVLRPSPWLASPVPHGDAPSLLGLPNAASHDTSPLLPSAEKQRQRIGEALVSYSAKANQDDDRSSHSLNRVSGTAVLPEVDNEERGFFSSLQIIGQYRNSYILCQDREDLLLIDQHAAHERIRFESLRSQYMQGCVQRQALLFPVTVELDFREAASFAENIDQLNSFGFEIEHFGGKTYVLKAVPHLLADKDTRLLLHDVAGELSMTENSRILQDSVDSILSVMACHSAVRANRHLSSEEMLSLLRELDTIDFSANCPHGRPVMYRIALAEIERMFKRT